jgi:hypothetical protein
VDEEQMEKPTTDEDNGTVQKLEQQHPSHFFTNDPTHNTAAEVQQSAFHWEQA